MRQTPDEITPHSAERLCGEVARRDDNRIARRLSRQQVVAGVSRLGEGALLAVCLALWAEDPVGHREHERAAGFVAQR
jgi:hypothetical protein